MVQSRKKWTLSELHRLPDDGNKYELVRGELYVTPPPSDQHEELLAILHELLVPYVARHGLGRVYRPRAVLRRDGSEVEPDLMVRPIPPKQPIAWEEAPIPVLVIEVLSGATRRRDLEQKRNFYMDLGVPEYWAVDSDRRDILVIRRGRPDEALRTSLLWQPAKADEALTIDVAALFAQALGSV